LDALFDRDVWIFNLESNVPVEHQLPRHKIRLFVMKNLQELPQKTRNVVCLHPSTPAHLVCVHHSLGVKEGKEHLVQADRFDLFLDGACICPFPAAA
jgi:hypothetical protein